MPGLGFGPFLATTGWEWDGRVEDVMVWRCLAHNAVIASHRVAWQSSMGWYRLRGERSRGCPSVCWIVASSSH